MVYCLCAGFGQARFTDPKCHFTERTYLPAEAKTLDFRLSGAVYREINRAPIKSKAILRRMVRSPRRHPRLRRGTFSSREEQATSPEDA
jgi:hypothetical protein